jgi:RNA polymerase sigma factor (sigma-70 family)
MASVRRSGVIRQVQALFDEGTIGGLSDGQLLERFANGAGEAAAQAFAVLVERHGPMVLRTCRSILRDPHDTQDAFQATFLVLVRRARSLWVRESLGPWLHQVAYRTASCRRAAAARRRRHERQAADRANLSVPSGDPDELGAIVHEELARLPEPFRAAVVLCLVEGLTHEQAARRLGWPVGTVESRLARGRSRLRARLSVRGLASTVGVMTAALAAGRARAAVPAALAEATVRAAVRIAGGQAAVAEVVSADVLALANGVSRGMSITMTRMAGGIVLAAIGAGVWAGQEGRAREGVTSAPPPQPTREQASAIVAQVDGMPITRDELIERCLAKYGAKELDLLINTSIIRRECESRGLTVTAREVEAEVARVARRMGLTPDAWYRNLEKERGWSRDVYLNDIVSPNLMAEKLSVIGSFTSLEELKSKSHVEVFLGEARARRGAKTQDGARPQQDRLGIVERKLDETIESLKSLRRELKR